jgi:hypothetical protein
MRASSIGLVELCFWIQSITLNCKYGVEALRMMPSLLRSASPVRSRLGSGRPRPTEHAASLHRSPPRVAESNLKSGHAVLGKMGHTSIARESGVDIVGQEDRQECGGYVST